MNPLNRIAATSPVRTGAANVVPQDPTIAGPADQFQASAGPSPTLPVAGAEQGAAAPPPTPMQQAQSVVAQAQAVINQVGNSTTPIGEGQARQLLSVIASTSAQLTAIGKAGGSDASLSQYVQSTLTDLASAREDYAAMAGDITKDDSEDQQIEQQADQQVDASDQQDIASDEAADAAAVDGVAVGTDEDAGDGGDDSVGVGDWAGAPGGGPGGPGAGGPPGMDPTMLGDEDGGAAFPASGPDQDGS